MFDEKVKKTINNYIYYSGILFVVVGVGASLYGNVGGGAVSVSAGFILFIFGLIDIDRVREVNIFNVALKLDKKLNEAEEIVNKMRSVLIPLSRMSIDSASLALKEHKGLSRKELHDYVEDIRKSLLAVETPDDTIEEIKTSYHYAFLHCMLEDVRDGTNRIFFPIQQRYQKERNDKLAERQKELSNHSMRESDIIGKDDYRILEVASIGLDVMQHLRYQVNPDSYLELYKSYIYNIDALNSEVKEKIVEGMKPMLLDIDDYMKTKKINKKEEFLSKN